MEGDEESQGGVSQPALEQEASQQQSKWREEGLEGAPCLNFIPVHSC